MRLSFFLSIKKNHDHKEWQGTYGYDTMEYLRINVDGFVVLKCDCDASWSHLCTVS